MEDAASLEPKKVLGLFARNGKLQNFFVFFPIVLHTPCSMLYAFRNPQYQTGNPPEGQIHNLQVSIFV